MGCEKMLLAADIGNTNITLGVFDNETLIETFRLASDKNMLLDEYVYLLNKLCESHNITDCIIVSVVDKLDVLLKSACDKAFGINSFLFNKHSNTGLKIDLKNPEEVGADRIANAIAAKNLYKTPVIVVDLGTATTFDIISAEGNFIGGVIMPGLNLQFRALNTNTSKLPLIDAKVSEKAIGDSTENAMLSGIIRGSASAIEGLINQCELELKQKATIIATGGYCELISKYMIRSFDYVNPTLTLQGLAYLYEINRIKEKSL